MNRRSSDQERGARAFHLFREVVELHGDERRDALDAGCLGDEMLRAEVLAMLSLDALDDGSMDGAPGMGRQVIARDLLDSMIAGGNFDPDAVEEPPEAIGPYRIVGVLGSGGMGVVYEAEQAHPRRRVAIKTVHPWLRSPSLAARFDFEVQALASLRHRAIPRLFEVREEAGNTWMIMELVHGERLTTFAAGRDLATRMALLREVVSGVHSAHAAGITHRDLKPSNVIVCDGQPRILDFGLAAPIDDADGSFAAVGGTVAYMAPEQLAATARVDHRADIYALGVLAYELFTGVLPIPLTAAPLAEALRAKREAAIPPPSTLVPGLRTDLDHIIARALAVDPEARYASATELDLDLARYVAVRPIAARRHTIAYRARLALLRHRTLFRAVTATLALVVAVVGVFIGISAWEALREAEAREERAGVRLTALDARLENLADAGDLAKADALFDAFAAMRENAGTRALFDAWLRRAAREQRLGRAAAVVDAYAGAYAAAPDDASRARALIDLGETFTRQGAWSRADRVLDRIQQLSGDTDPRAAALRASVLAYRRDLRGAADAKPDGPLAPVLRAFEHATPLGAVSSTATRVAGAPEATVLLWDQPAQQFVVVAVSPPRVVATVARPALLDAGHNMPRLVAGSRDLLFARARAQGSMFLRVGAEPPYLTELPGPRLASLWASATWVDTAGTERIAVGSAGVDRRLLVGSAGSAESWTAPAAVLGPPGDIDAVLCADLDGDGVRELVVATGAWSNYALRVLRPTADGRLEPLGERLFGATSQVELLPRPGTTPLIVATKVDRYPNASILGADTPFGEPPGTYVFTWGHGQLHELVWLPYPPTLPPRAGPQSLVVGDFDGDGLGDIALGGGVQDDEVLFLYRQTSPLHFEVTALSGLDPLAAANLDDDVADELVVRAPWDEHRAWVLGVGDAPIPFRPRPAGSHDSLGPPPTHDPALQRAWTSAWELAEMGLVERAVTELDAAAEIAETALVRAHFLLRGAALYDDLEEPERATAMCEEVLATPGLPEAVALAGHLTAARSYLGNHQVAQALSHFAALAEGDGVEGAEARVALTQLGAVSAATAPPRAVIAGSSVDPGWELVAPESFARNLTNLGGVGVTTFSDQGVIASLPVRSGGGQVRIELEATLEHVEIGSGVAVELRAAGSEAPLMRLYLGATGGSDEIREFLGCGPDDGKTPAAMNQSRPIDAPPERIRMALDFLPTTAQLGCTVAAGDEVRVRRRFLALPIPPGDYDLVVTSEGERSWTSVMMARVTLNKLTVTGLTPRGREQGPIASAHRALFEGDLGSAAAVYEAEKQPGFSFLAALDGGHFEDAAAIARGMGADAIARDPTIRHLLRARPAVVTALLAGVEESALNRILATVWETAARYIDDPAIASFLQTLPPSFGRVSTPEAAAVLTARARMLLRAGDPARALRLWPRPVSASR